MSLFLLSYHYSHSHNVTISMVFLFVCTIADVKKPGNECPCSYSHIITISLVLLLLSIIYCTPSSQLSSPFSTTTIPTPYHTTSLSHHSLPYHKQAHQNSMHILHLSHVWLGWGCCRSIWSKVAAYQSYFGSSLLSFRYPFFSPTPSHSYNSPYSHSPFLSSRIPPPYDYHYPTNDY